MVQRIGFVGWVDGKQVFFNGDIYYAVISGKNFAIDWERIPDRRKKRLC